MLSEAPALSGRFPYAFALGMTALVAILSIALGRILGDPAPLSLFVVASIVSAWYGGLGPGLLATAVGGVAGSYFHLQPVHPLTIYRPADWVRLGSFLVAGAVVSWLSEALHRARRQATAEARQAREVLAQLETERGRLHTVLESIPAGVVVAEAPSGRIVLGNAQAERILGHPLLPTSDLESYQEWFGYDLDGRRLTADEYPLVLALRGVTLKDRNFLYQPEGGTRRWIRASSVPIRDAHGNVTGGVVLFSDVSQERQAEEALRASELRLEVALAASSLGSWHLDLDTGTLTCSATFKANFGRPPDLPFGYSDLLDAIHPDDRQGMQAAVRRAIEEEKEYQEDYRVIWPDGSLHWIAARGRTTYEDGRPVAMDGVTLDFTQRKSLEESLRRQTEALQEADRRKNDFLAMLAHELRNPLAPIRNALQILALRGGAPRVVAEARELMERQVQQMVRLVDDLLEVSRISRGKVRLQKTPLDLAGVIAAAVETSRPLIEARRHELTVTPPERPVRVEADPTRLAQVLANLLNNAAKYTEVGGRIHLAAGREDGDAVLRVRDNGVGIAPEMLPRVFDLFIQADSTLDHSQGGLGLGLTLARQLVEMHGGTLEAHSDGVGRGSEFVVRLPALEEEAEEAPELLPAPAEEVEARRILVVDDNVDSAESLAMLLQLYGHEVRLTHDGEAALEEVRTFVPDIVLLDIGLPKLDGYGVAQRLRQEPRLGRTTLIAITGYGQEEDRRRTREAGFHHHLVKPLDLDALRDLLATVPSSGQGLRPE